MCVEHNIETLRTRLTQVVDLRDTQGIRQDHRAIVARLDEVEEYASASTFREFMTKKKRRLESMLVNDGGGTIGEAIRVCTRRIDQHQATLDDMRTTLSCLHPNGGMSWGLREWTFFKYQQGNKGFLVVLCACFFPFVSSWSPVVLTHLVVCNCVIHPCFLTLVVMFSFLAVVVFPCFYSSLSLLCSLLFIQLFVFAVFSLGVTKTHVQSIDLQFCMHCTAASAQAPDKGVCQSLLVRAGIIVLRSPALLSSKRSGHCVFVGTITGLLRHNRL